MLAFASSRREDQGQRGSCDVVWKYETDESPKVKHHWDKDEAGTVLVGNVVVSKCPSGLSVAECQGLLNDGYEWTPRGWNRDYPQRIYAVRDGVVYRATPTNPGISYHGFPELRYLLPPDRKTREAIVELARRDGTEEEVVKWLQ